MFNTTIHKTETNPVTRVIEKSITPDKVTEMYDKVKEQIDKDTVNRILFRSDLLTGIVSQRIDPMTRTTEIMTSFKLNGQLFERSHFFFNMEKFAMLGTTELLEELINHYRDEVSKILLETAFTSVDTFRKYT